MAKIGNLAATISLDSAAFVRGIRESQREINKITSGVKRSTRQFIKWGSVVTGSAVVATTLLVKNNLKYIDTLAKTSDRLGVNIKDLAAYRDVAELAGIGVKRFDLGLQRMTIRIAEAVTGTGRASDTIKALGLNARELAVRGPAFAFAEIADAMKLVESRTERVRLSFNLFGTTGVGFLNILQQGSAGLRAATKDSELLGSTVDRLGAQQVQDAIMAMKRFSLATRRAGLALAVQLSPFITAAANIMTKWVVSSQKSGSFLVDVFEGIVSAVAKVGDVILSTELTFKKFQSGLASAKLNLAVQLGDTDAVNNLIKDLNTLFFEINALEGSVKPSTKVSDFFANIRDRAKEAAAAALTLKGIGVGAASDLPDTLIDVAEASRRAAAELRETNRALADQKQFASGIGLAFGSAFAQATTAADKFGDALKGLAQDIARVLINRVIARPIANAIGSFFGPEDSTDAATATIPAEFSSSPPIPSSIPLGGPAPPTAFARGGVVTSPRVFPMARGLGLMGEAGAEGVLPLERMGDGDLGVRAKGFGGGGVAVNVQIINNSPEPVTAAGSVGPDGTAQLLVQIGEQIAGDVATGGPVSRSIGRAFGLRRTGGQR